MSEYVHVGAHAEILHTGAHLAPGQRITDEDLRDGDLRLIDDGVLVDVSSFDSGPSNEPDHVSVDQMGLTELRERARQLDLEGRSKMSADELRAGISAHEAVATAEEV